MVKHKQSRNTVSGSRICPKCLEKTSPYKFSKLLQFNSYMEFTFPKDRWNIATAATLYPWANLQATFGF